MNSIILLHVVPWSLVLNERLQHSQEKTIRISQNKNIEIDTNTVETVICDLQRDFMKKVTYDRESLNTDPN